MVRPSVLLDSILLQGGLVPRGSRVVVFQEIYWVFLILGTLVGVVVIGYMFQKAYRYRASAAPPADDDKVDRPQLGELPTGSGGGRKLFVSFALSAIIVISLITWTYFTLLYVEGNVASGQAAAAPGAQQQVDSYDQLRVKVVGYQFGWRFVYPNGHVSDGTLRLPEGAEVQLAVTSEDVFHNFGIPAFRVKTDAIPGQTTRTWFVADEVGTYSAQCYELCGSGHSYMTAEVVVMPPEEFGSWYASTENETANSSVRTGPDANVASGVSA